VPLHPLARGGEQLVVGLDGSHREPGDAGDERDA
jgi:hypothetical protein